jgi:hypothetical protein
MRIFWTRNHSDRLVRLWNSNKMKGNISVTPNFQLSLSQVNHFTQRPLIRTQFYSFTKFSRWFGGIQCKNFIDSKSVFFNICIFSIELNFCRTELLTLLTSYWIPWDKGKNLEKIFIRGILRFWCLINKN